jgi:uncharacterized iron-regulated membrane protein
MTKNKLPKSSNTNLLKLFRKLHRISSVYLIVFFLIMSVTGILLGLKKHSRGYLLADTEQGSTTDLTKWLAADTLYKIASQVLRDSIDVDLPTEINRIDMRPRRGTVKFVFRDHYWGVQLDGATGELLKVERRRSDIIENIHTGLIIDFYFNTRNEPIKLVYTVVMGLALLALSVTGFWIWYAPRRKKRKKNQYSN